MAVEHHIESLERKHARLDDMLHEEETRPAPDDMLVHRLKSQKLSVKDEIESLRHPSVAA